MRPLNLLLGVFVAFTDAHLRIKSFKYKKDHKSEGRDILQILSVSNIAKCAYQCTANKDCDDANFHKESKVCQLLRKKPEGALLSLVQQTGFLYVGNYDGMKKAEKINQGTSCKTLYDSGRSTGSKAYNLTFGNTTNWSMTYCLMNPIAGCGPGGWTLVMKVDGNKNVFKYSSPLWTNKEAYNELAGQTGTESLKETKMPTFWRTPFTKLCLGMKSLRGDVNWMMISKTSDSMLSLLAGGVAEIITTPGPSAWKSLFPNHALQVYTDSCARGFNIANKASRIYLRIGMFGDDDNQCGGTNSYLGIGAESADNSVSCGSSNTLHGPSPSTNCFIFVQ